MFKQFREHLTKVNMGKPKGLYINFLRAIHVQKIMQIWHPANEKSLNAILSHAGLKKLAREM